MVSDALDYIAYCNIDLMASAQAVLGSFGEHVIAWTR